MTVRELINQLLDADDMDNEVVLEVNKEAVANSDWNYQLLKIDSVNNCYSYSYITSHARFEDRKGGGEK